MNRSLEMIEIIAEGLGDLLDKVVFIGGATAFCYIDNLASSMIRPTEDVDCVVHFATRSEYYSFEDDLRKHHFQNLVEHGAPICRWNYKNIKVDIMPSEAEILGFTNAWYKTGIDTSKINVLPSGRAIRIFTLPLFIASKIEAYKYRGEKDPRFSHDIEDIILVLDGQKDLTRLSDAPDSVREYLQKEFKSLVADDRFSDSLKGYLGQSVTSHERAAKIKKFLQEY